MTMLKRDYPESFIVAHEVNYIDHEKMSDWWSRKRVQQLAAKTTQAWFHQIGITSESGKSADKRK